VRRLAILQHTSNEVDACCLGSLTANAVALLSMRKQGDIAGSAPWPSNLHLPRGTAFLLITVLMHCVHVIGDS
jgi:hypothetical protein